MTSYRLTETFTQTVAAVPDRRGRVPLARARELVGQWLDDLRQRIGDELAHDGAEERVRRQLDSAQDLLMAAFHGVLTAVYRADCSPGSGQLSERSPGYGPPGYGTSSAGQRGHDPSGTDRYRAGRTGQAPGDDASDDRQPGYPPPGYQPHITMGAVKNFLGLGSAPAHRPPVPESTPPVPDNVITVGTLIDQLTAACEALDTLLDAAEPPPVRHLNLPWAKDPELLGELHLLLTAHVTGNAESALQRINNLADRLRARHSIVAVTASAATADMFQIRPNPDPADPTYATAVPALVVDGRLVFTGEARGPAGSHRLLRSDIPSGATMDTGGSARGQEE